MIIIIWMGAKMKGVDFTKKSQLIVRLQILSYLMRSHRPCVCTLTWYFAVPAFLFAPYTAAAESSKHKLVHFFFSFYISKFCRLKSVVTSISLNPRVATNLKKKKRKKKREKKYKMIFSRQSALKMFSTETPFKVQESSAYSPPLSPSSQCFKVVIRCDSLSKPQWGFYTIRAAVPSYLGGILLAI